MNIFIFLLIYSVCRGAVIITMEPTASPAFRSAVFEAVSIVERFVSFDRDVNGLFVERHLAPGIIGNAETLYSRDEQTPFVLLPSALYVQKYKSIDLHPYYHFTVQITNATDIVFSTSHYDLVSALVHEIAHGLGIASRVLGDGSFTDAPFATIFDIIVFSLKPSDPHTSLDNVTFQYYMKTQSLQYALPLGHMYKLYFEQPFKVGSSIEHGYCGVMNHRAYYGAAFRTLDAFTFYLLRDMGYTMKNCTPDWSTVCGFCETGSTCIVSGASSLNCFLF